MSKWQNHRGTETRRTWQRPKKESSPKTNASIALHAGEIPATNARPRISVVRFRHVLVRRTDRTC
jgi:hypothetical protein